MEEHEYLIRLGRFKTSYEQLLFTCEVFQKSRQTQADKAVFVRRVFNLFADDSGMDWTGDVGSLRKFAAAIVQGRGL